MSADKEQMSGDPDRRRRRMSAAKVRELMLAAAHDIILEAGVSLSLEEVSMEDVMRQADVPRSSVYRIWPYKGDFIDDLITHMAGPEWFGTATFDQESMDLAATILMSHPDRLNSEDGRRSLMREAIRVAAEGNFRSIVASMEWKIYLSTIGTAGTMRASTRRRNLAQALEASEINFVTNMAALYKAMVEMIGFRMRDGYSYEHLALAAASALEGLALRGVIAELTKDKPQETPQPNSWSINSLINSSLSGPGLDGPADWTFAASTFLAVLEGFLEPDPTYRPPGHQTSLD